MDPQRARKIIERQCDGVLLPDVKLAFDDEEFADCTVADILANPAGFEGATLADPLEGIAYGRTKAKVMRRADGTPWINSFAHGRTVYELRFDHRTAAAVIDKASADDVDDVFVQCALVADLDACEAEKLRDGASNKSGTGKRALDRKLSAARKAAAARQAEEDRARRLAERQDPRPRLAVPPIDAEFTPHMATLNDVLGRDRSAEPPTRNTDGSVAMARELRALSLHALTSKGINIDA
jgi:hypothetical protein